jgi:hypothetical protein
MLCPDVQAFAFKWVNLWCRYFVVDHVHVVTLFVGDIVAACLGRGCTSSA